MFVLLLAGKLARVATISVAPVGSVSGWPEIVIDVRMIGVLRGSGAEAATGVVDGKALADNNGSKVSDMK